MADPVVHLTAGVPDSGTGNITTLGQLAGVAGTPSTLVQTVQGAASMTALKVDASATTQPVSASALPLPTGAATAAKQPALGTAGTASTDVISVQGIASGTALPVSPSVDLGSGTSGTKTQRVILDSSQLSTLATSAQAMSNGFQEVGLPTDQPVPNKVQAQANGMTSSRVNAANSTNATSLKASGGALVEIDVFNVAAYSVFLKFYNKASSPTVGTDTPFWTIPIAAVTGYSKPLKYGKWMGTGIAYAITKLQADSDTTVVAVGDLTGSIDWI